MHYPNSSNQRRGQRGFTLLEVLVAMALIGVGFSAAFVAISGSRRLSEKSVTHDSARILARAKLDEVLHSKDNLLTDDGKEDRYGNQLYGYQIKVRPVNLPLPDGVDKAALPVVLEDVSIDVFWGPSGSQQSYRLSTMRLSQKTVPQTSTPAPAPSPTPAGSLRPPPTRPTL